MATVQQFTTPAPQATSANAGILSNAALTSATAATRPALTADETMLGQIGKITASDNPYMQAAKTAADQNMNKRGLLNSSMAVGASQKAAYDAAMPIAQFDANAMKSVGDMQFNANQQTNMTNAQQANQTSQFNTTAANQMEQFNAEQGNKLTLANMDAGVKTALADVEANYKTLMAADAQAQDIFKTVLNNITDINNSSTMDATAKTTAIQNQKNALQSAFRIIEGMNSLAGLDELLTF